MVAVTFEIERARTRERSGSGSLLRSRRVPLVENRVL